LAKVLSAIPLSSNPEVYAPSKLIARSRQLKQLREFVDDVLKGCHSSTIFISGPKSMGKTVTVLNFIKTLKSSNVGVDAVYIRCKFAFRETLKPVMINVPGSICSAFEALISRYNQPLLLFFDEFHNLKGRKKEINVLLRSLYDSYKGEVIPTIISNMHFAEMKKLFEDDLLSRMSWDLASFINFPAYNLNEMFNILLQRCQEALAPNSWEEAAILECARYGAKTKNLRDAIDLLRNACLKFPNEKLKKEHVEICLDTAGIRALAEDLNNETPHVRLYLTAIALEQLNTPKVTTAVVERRYRNLCESTSETPIKFTYRLRKRLEEIGIITIETKRYNVIDARGRRTRGSTTFLLLEENPEKLIKTLSICEWDDLIEGTTLKEKLSRIKEMLRISGTRPNSNE